MALREPAEEVVRDHRRGRQRAPPPGEPQRAVHGGAVRRPEVPVHEGATGPLKRDLQTATFFHGEDGLGDRGYPPAAPPPGARRMPCRRPPGVRPGTPRARLVTLGPADEHRARARARRRSRARGRPLRGHGRGRLHRREHHPGRRVQHLGATPRRRAFVSAPDSRIEMVGWELSRERRPSTSRSSPPFGPLDTDAPATSPSTATRRDPVHRSRLRAPGISACPTRWRWRSPSTPRSSPPESAPRSTSNPECTLTRGHDRGRPARRRAPRSRRPRAAGASRRPRKSRR